MPRFLLDLLDVDRRGLRRRDLFDLLADVPVTRSRRAAASPIAAWERASRDAGVVKDEQWTPRLRSHAAWQRRAAPNATRDDEPLDDATPVSPTADAAESLADVRRRPARRSRPSAATRTLERVGRLVRGPDRRTGIGTATLQHLDEAEFQAWEHTTRVLDRLRHLDARRRAGDA